MNETRGNRNSAACFPLPRDVIRHTMTSTWKIHICMPGAVPEPTIGRVYVCGETSPPRCCHVVVQKAERYDYPSETYVLTLPSKHPRSLAKRHLLYCVAPFHSESDIRLQLVYKAPTEFKLLRIDHNYKGCTVGSVSVSQVSDYVLGVDEGYQTNPSQD